MCPWSHQVLQVFHTSFYCFSVPLVHEAQMSSAACVESPSACSCWLIRWSLSGRGWSLLEWASCNSGGSWGKSIGVLYDVLRRREYQLCVGHTGAIRRNWSTCSLSIFYSTLEITQKGGKACHSNGVHKILNASTAWQPGCRCQDIKTGNCLQFNVLFENQSGQTLKNWKI